MSGRTVADVLMGAARAASDKKGRPPLKHTAKEKEDAKKTVVAEEAAQGAVAPLSVDDKIANLLKKASVFAQDRGLLDGWRARSLPVSCPSPRLDIR